MMFTVKTLFICSNIINIKEAFAVFGWILLIHLAKDLALAGAHHFCLVSCHSSIQLVPVPLNHIIFLYILSLKPAHAIAVLHPQALQLAMLLPLHLFLLILQP